MWKSITNPINGKKVIVDSMEGRTLIKSYFIVYNKIVEIFLLT